MPKNIPSRQELYEIVIQVVRGRCEDFGFDCPATISNDHSLDSLGLEPADIATEVENYWFKYYSQIQIKGEPDEWKTIHDLVLALEQTLQQESNEKAGASTELGDNKPQQRLSVEKSSVSDADFASSSPKKNQSASEYFVLYCDFPACPECSHDCYLDIDDGIELEGVTTWSTGKRFEKPIQTPIVLQGRFQGEHKGDPKELYDGTLCLMSSRLVAALRSMGVENIDAYPAVVRTNRNTDIAYEAVNIIGLVSADAINEKSFSSHDGAPPLIDASVEGFQVSPHKTGGRKLFRLLENVGTMVVSREIRDGLLARGITTLRFIDPKDWVRL